MKGIARIGTFGEERFVVSQPHPHKLRVIEAARLAEKVQSKMRQP